MEKNLNYDVVILGAGPAGLQAAIHAARKKVSVMVVGKETKSSLYNAHIENYAFLFKGTGEEMLKVGREQAEKFGADFLDEDILQISEEASGFNLKTERGFSLRCYALIVATGTSRHRLGVPGEKSLLGKGVSYCVDCDGHFFKGDDVAVIGNESAAVDGALTMVPIAKSVHLIANKIEASEELLAQLRASDIKVHEGAGVKEIAGEHQVAHLSLENGKKIEVSGVFIEIGAKGFLELATSLGVQLDDDMKYIRINKKQETTVAGVYAAGDVCGPPWQLAKAVGEGCVAGIEAANYAKSQR
jgi:thioredoxin reductase (NADPH)